MIAAGFGGAVGSGLDVALLVLLVEHSVSVPVSAFVAASAGAAVNFVMNKYIAFRDRSPITGRQLARFGVVAVMAAMLMALTMKIVAVELGVPYLLAKLGCAAAIFVVWTYPAQRRVFARPAPAG